MHDDYGKAFLTYCRIRKTNLLLWKNHINLARTLLVIFVYLAGLIGAIVLLLA
jgi:hypothetical protein